MIAMTSSTKEPHTLDQFSLMVDAHVGERVGFSDAVKTLHLARTEQAVVKARRGVLWEALGNRHAQGQRVIQTSPGRGVFIYESSYTTTPKVTVPSTAAKKANPALWKQAHARQPFVKVAAPAKYVAPVRTFKLPPAPTLYTDAQTLYLQYSSEQFAAILDGLKNTESEAKSQLIKIANLADWDGSVRTFADGWAVGTHRMAYDAEKLRRIDKDVFKALAVEVAGKTVTRLRTIDLDLAVEQGLCDLGDFDGFAQ